MNTPIDSLTIKDFEFLYGVTRLNIYNRIKGLTEKGYHMEPEKQSGKSVFNANQIALMNSLDSYIKGSGTLLSLTSLTVLQDKLTCLIGHRTQELNSNLLILRLLHLGWGK